MAYLYETHMHTCYGSACGRSTGKEHVRYYKEIGYTGIIITDHFFGGNTAVSRELPWRERINLFWRGYEDAREEGDRVGLDVFFGLEQGFSGDEYLIYGLTKEYMLEHPEMEHWTRRQQLDEVHRAGGCVLQAHPFRIRDYMDRIRLGDLFCDGVEAANAGNEQLDDARCMQWAEENGFVMTAGSDNHLSPPKNGTYGVLLDEKLNSIADYVSVILQKKPIGLYVPPERFIMPEPETDERHLAWRLDAQERPVRTEREWMERRNG